MPIVNSMMAGGTQRGPVPEGPARSQGPTQHAEAEQQRRGFTGVFEVGVGGRMARVPQSAEGPIRLPPSSFLCLPVRAGGMKLGRRGQADAP